MRRTLICMMVIWTCTAVPASAGDVSYLNQNSILPSQDRFCGAYVVWHALNYYDRNCPIDELTLQLSLDVQEGCSVADVGSVLKAKGIDPQPLKMAMNELSEVRQPFVLYLKPKLENIGHLLFCVPLRGGQMLVVDGTRMKRVDLWQLKKGQLSTDWDGTVLLLPVRGEAMGNRNFFGVGALALGALTVWQLKKMVARRGRMLKAV